MSSNCCGTEPIEKIKRWSKNKHQYIEAPCHLAFKKYNRCIGGVDIYDLQMEFYTIRFEAQKWSWKLRLHFIGLTVVNSLFHYKCDVAAKKIPKRNQTGLLLFKLQIAETPVVAAVVSRNINNEIKIVT